MGHRSVPRWRTPRRRNPTILPLKRLTPNFSDRYGDANAREAYGHALAAAERANDKTQTAEAIARLAVLDLIAGDRDAAAAHAEAYRGATGKTLSIGKPVASEAWPTAPIPGPMRSFARMAAISPDSNPRDVLPALARNVVTNGYQASHSNEALEQTEYLKLVHRYLSQARELEKLAGDKQIIEVENCDSPNVAELLRILGLPHARRLRIEVVLETVNAARAFLTTDSGFPVNELEQALRTNRPFTYDYHPPPVPVLFGPEYWMRDAKDKRAGRLHRSLHLRSLDLPPVPGPFQAGRRDRRSAAQGRYLSRT